MPASDAELTQIIQAADQPGGSADSALEELYRRHRPAVLAYARTCCRDAHTAEDLVSEAFARTLSAVRAGNGPESAWRPYLLSVVRNTAADWAATLRRTDLSADFEQWLEASGTEGSGEDHALRQEEDALLLRGFRTLPERWQSVLWHTVVEGESVEQVGAILGIGPSGVGSLAARAREGLREAYLTAHIASGDSAECRYFSSRLATAIRRGRRPTRDLARHLDRCSRCGHAVTELTDLNARMRKVLPGALLVWAPSFHTAAHLTRMGTAIGAGKTLGHLAKIKLNALSASAVTAAVAATTVGGYLLLPDTRNSTLPTGRPPSASSISATLGSTSPPLATSQSAETSAPTALPKPAAITRLRIDSTSRCMETSNSPGAEPHEAACTGSASQIWELVRDTAGRLQLRNQASKLCLTYPDQLPDGAAVRQAVCGTDTRGQWWDYSYSQKNGTIIFNPRGDNGRRLGLNKWNFPGTGKPYDPTIGITLNYYNTLSLVFRVDGKLFG